VNRRLELATGRLIALIVGIPLCLAAIGWTAITEVAYAGQGSYQVRLSIPTHGRPVTISLDSGDLHVDQATSDRLRISGTALYSLVRSTVTWKVTSAGVTVNSHCRFVTWVCSFDYHVAVPPGVSESFANGSGDITVTGLTNPRVTASNGAGNITLTFVTVPQRVTIDDSFGNVTVMLPPGTTTYKVSTRASLGTTSVTVPTSPTSRHVITVVDSSGNIFIMQ